MRIVRVSMVLSLVLLVTPALSVRTVTAHPVGGLTFCGGTAPETLACTTGTHDHVLPVWNFLYLYAPTNLTGTIESALHWPAGGTLPEQFVSSYSCDVENGVFRQCRSSGQIAPPGVAVRHACRVFRTGFPAPSGTGLWECGVAHDQVPPPATSSGCAVPYVPGVSTSCTFALTAHPLGALGAFPGANLLRIAVDIEDPDGNLLARCTPQLNATACAILWDTNLPLGTPLTCRVRDNGSGAMAGLFGCSAGL